MNLVEHIKDQLSEESAGKLGSLISEGEGKTKAALTAVVPALLSALYSLTTNTAGAEKLAAAVTKFEPDLAVRLKNMTSGEAQAVLDEGNAALHSLFGGPTLTALTETLVKNTELSKEKIQKLIGYLTALVLGSLAGQLKGQTASASTLVGLFADQKENLASAVPADLSLERVPGVGMKPTAESSNSMTTIVGAVLAFAVIVAAGWLLFMGNPLFPKNKQTSPSQTTSKK